MYTEDQIAEMIEAVKKEEIEKAEKKVMCTSCTHGNKMRNDTVF